MRNEYPLYLNGVWTPQTDGCVREDIEPATGKPLFAVHRAGPADVETALASAAAAFPGWAAAMADVRERVLLRAADIMESRAEEFVELLVREGGKAQSIARGEFAGSVNLFRVAAGECRRHTTEMYPAGKPGQMSLAVRHSLGVILGILPFNYPLILSVKKLAFALAAGNSFILKPSPHTPAVCLLLGEVLHEAGLPAGVLNVVRSQTRAFPRCSRRISACAWCRSPAAETPGGRSPWLRRRTSSARRWSSAAKTRCSCCATTISTRP